MSPLNSQIPYVDSLSSTRNPLSIWDVWCLEVKPKPSLDLLGEFLLLGLELVDLSLELLDLGQDSGCWLLASTQRRAQGAMGSSSAWGTYKQ